jgi:tRNA pseudouridine32 synthase/23S rRNA pseudouridine746 synthase
MYRIVEEHPAFVVIYKHPGVSFHSETGEPGLFETLRQREGYPELYPVHRLDKITSGLLVMARTADANRALIEQFATRQAEKYYLAISDRKPRKKQGMIRGDMAPARRGSWKLCATTENPAITQFFSSALTAGRRLFVVRPRTGKTHQIRVALKSLGAPILGDALYGDALTSRAQDRVYLHAWCLGFTLGDQAYRFEALPEEGEAFMDNNFLTALEAYRNPWALPWPTLT